jgi:hypothetical protein
METSFTVQLGAVRNGVTRYDLIFRGGTVLHGPAHEGPGDGEGPINWKHFVRSPNKVGIQERKVK